jgi:hypothetical protein
MFYLSNDLTWISRASIISLDLIEATISFNEIQITQDTPYL